MRLVVCGVDPPVVRGLKARPHHKQRACTIAVNQNVRSSQKFGEPTAVVGVVQVKREVKNAHAVQRASCVQGYPPTGEAGGLAPIDQRLNRYCLPLGMVRPFLELPHRGGVAPRFNNGRLEFVCVQLRRGGNYRLFLLRSS